MEIARLAREVDRMSKQHPIGELQKIRREIKGLERRPTTAIFSEQQISKFAGEGYVYHRGGRKELQYNLGREGSENIRYGVAFSLQPGISLPDVSILFPKIDRFNEFLTLHASEFSDMRMWHYSGTDQASEQYMPGPISPELVQPKTFIFLGKRTQVHNVRVEDILEDFDRLLPLYKYVESHDAAGPEFPHVTTNDTGFSFTPGHTLRKRKTTASPSSETIDVSLRHGKLQDTLVAELEDEYGSNSVGSEISNGTGGKIDVVVRKETGFDFYEIKTARSARSCLRQALSQLLEYSYWPGAQEGDRLVVVGEPQLDAESNAYLTKLRNRFSLPINYRQVDA